MTVKRRSFLVGVGVFLIFLFGVEVCSGEEPRTIEVWKNLYTVVNGEGVDSNSTFLVTKEGVIVVDTRVTPKEAKKLRTEIRKITDLPILYVINTHYHGDHTFGNQVFKDSRAIIAHENVQKNLIGETGEMHLDQFKSRNIPGMEDTVITIPNMIFKDKMEIYVGGYHLQLIHVRGHTDGDLFIYIKELRTLITGDLVSNNKIPYLGDGYVEEWISSLRYMGDLDAEIYIPGHGVPGGKPVYLAMKFYFFNLKSLVLQQLEEGKSLKETQEAVRPILMEKYKLWKNLHLIDSNIKRVYMEYSLKQDS
jgi:cyclase